MIHRKLDVSIKAKKTKEAEDIHIESKATPLEVLEPVVDTDLKKRAKKAVATMLQQSVATTKKATAKKSPGKKK